MLNRVSTPRLTTKVDINLGYACNLKCPFCYYYDSVVTGTNLNTLDTDEAKKKLLFAKRVGAEEIEFTGGEPTLRKDLPELVRFCKQDAGIKLVSIVTNGTVLSNRKVMDRLAHAGLDDVLISIHGHTAELHDQLTAAPGSFQRLLTGIDNIRAHNIRLRTNTVICKPNYRYTSEIVGLCIDKGVDGISLLGFNPIIQVNSARHAVDLYVRHSDAATEIKRALDRFASVLPPTNIRYMPFCFFKGYERFVTNHDQFSWEPDEWNNYLRVVLRDGQLRAIKRALFGFRDVRYKRFALKYGIKGVLTAGMQRHYARNKIKPDKCNGCAYENVCDYVWKGYHRRFGDEELQPIEGQRVSNPVWVTDAARLREPGKLPVGRWNTGNSDVQG